MSRPLPSASERVRETAAGHGLALEIREHAAPTRTAEEAAAACGCEVGAIVKSLVFAGRTSGEPFLLLVSGSNRVDEELAAAETGEPIVRPDGKAVRAWTGFAIGGIPPFGHARPLRTFMDEHLLRYGQVWAAAGTPNTVFPIDPRDLMRVTGARLCRLSR
ncbi:YbaK/EbsC family protein [Enterovirga aerilata]|uniref:YbaK/EbsC family protein n=1 Tax=Enterovirga aerilata TaxID=2730920 RepID=A0A849IDZ5_9HYPH|nr:YbaK/EbsC family protein [Enterovirga sp. DB1703]